MTQRPRKCVGCNVDLNVDVDNIVCKEADPLCNVDLVNSQQNFCSLYNTQQSKMQSHFNTYTHRPHQEYYQPKQLNFQQQKQLYQQKQQIYQKQQLMKMQKNIQNPQHYQTLSSNNNPSFYATTTTLPPPPPPSTHCDCATTNTTAHSWKNSRMNAYCTSYDNPT